MKIIKTSISFLNNNVNLEEIANLTTYIKEDMQAFNFLDNKRKVA